MNNEIRHRITVPKGIVKNIADRCGCSGAYVSKVLSGKCNQRRSDLQRNITRLALRMIDEE